MLEIIFIRLITLYQRYIRLALPSACRFSPSCSEYARQALVKYGLFRGALKAGKRLLLCHPFSQRAGYDPLT